MAAQIGLPRRGTLHIRPLSPSQLHLIILTLFAYLRFIFSLSTFFFFFFGNLLLCLNAKVNVSQLKQEQKQGEAAGGSLLAFAALTCHKKWKIIASQERKEEVRQEGHQHRLLLIIETSVGT